VNRISLEFSLLPFAVLCAGNAHAAQIDRLDVVRDGARYRVDMNVQLAAPAPRAFAVFADPALLPQINPSVLVARSLIEPDAANRLYTEVHLCISVLCHTLHQVQDMARVDAPDGGRLTADVLPARSDLRYGHAEWIFAGEAGATRLQFHLEVEPKFWVPPLIGPWLVGHMLRVEAERTSAGIERLAGGA
jgi:hypothetical protein